MKTKATTTRASCVRTVSRLPLASRLVLTACRSIHAIPAIDILSSGGLPDFAVRMSPQFRAGTEPSLVAHPLPPRLCGKERPLGNLIVQRSARRMGTFYICSSA
jgi:hypothetical protein